MILKFRLKVNILNTKKKKYKMRRIIPHRNNAIKIGYLQCVHIAYLTNV